LTDVVKKSLEAAVPVKKLAQNSDPIKSATKPDPSVKSKVESKKEAVVSCEPQKPQECPKSNLAELS
jgi:hypothetical protein